jgi:hypothetical protein
MSKLSADDQGVSQMGNSTFCAGYGIQYCGLIENAIHLKLKT